MLIWPAGITLDRLKINELRQSLTRWLDNIQAVIISYCVTGFGSANQESSKQSKIRRELTYMALGLFTNPFLLYRPLVLPSLNTVKELFLIQVDTGYE